MKHTPYSDQFPVLVGVVAVILIANELWWFSRVLATGSPPVAVTVLVYKTVKLAILIYLPVYIYRRNTRR